MFIIEMATVPPGRWIMLTDTCLAAQDKYKAYLGYFRIAYKAN